MLDGYIRMMVSRFWEERRLTHPHLSALFDLTHEIIRISSIPEDLRVVYMERLMKAKKVKVGSCILELSYLEAIYHRNINAMLEVEVDVQGGSVTIQDVDMSTKRVVSYMTELVSDVGKLYYMDVQFKNINPTTDAKNILEKLF